LKRKAIGNFASEIVSNAAHGGGLVGGILIGLFMLRKRNNKIPYQSSNLIIIFGIILILSGGIIKQLKKNS